MGDAGATVPGHPPSRLSFNLLNEAARPDAGGLLPVHRSGHRAIRAEDPKLIIADGLRWGGSRCRSWRAQIAQSTPGYDPMELTHYRLLGDRR